jgi:hypothetical protein
VQTDAGKQILSRAHLEALPHVKVTASEHGSPHVSFEGVALKSVPKKASVTFGESMKENDRQADSARLSTGRANLLVKKKGHTGSSFPTKRKMARWVRQVTTLKIVRCAVTKCWRGRKKVRPKLVL